MTIHPELYSREQFKCGLFYAVLVTVSCLLVSRIYLLCLLSGCKKRVLHGLSVLSERGKHDLDIVSSLIRVTSVEFKLKSECTCNR